jgi:hypothetical protein
MNMRLMRLTAPLVIGLGCGGVLSAQGIPATAPDFFELKVRPLLAASCYSCHTNSALGGLRLDSREALMKGGARGPSIVPGDPEKSILIQAVRQTDEKLKMPMGSKLKNEEIEILAEWVKAGAKWPEAPAAAKTASAANGFTISAEARKFWSFQPLSKPTPPATKNLKWAKNELDRFVLARLEKEGLQPVRAASKRDLLRRASLDLNGLPPTPEEIDAFEKDLSPQAFAKVVDRLLASPRFGERWGRIWLDVARFGEDDYRSLNPFPKGYYPYANAHLYRDWVIQAFNDDMPYDQFVKAQIAGDLLDAKVRPQAIAATGFLGLGPWYFDNGAVEVTRADERHDRVDVVTRGFLGLTVACARCHDHKYDPIPTTDYYSLAGVFLNTEYHEYPRAPKTVVTNFEKLEHEMEQKQKVLGEMQNNLSKQLSETLALQTASYLQGVFEITGSQKRDKATVVDQRKLDYELMDRWIRYLEKPTEKYPYKNAWQAMLKKGGNPAEAKKLAEEFQANVVRVMIARRELNEENEVIAAKALEGTKRKKRTEKPNFFVTNDDFCPGCGLQFKNLPDADNNFWIEVFQRELRDNEDPNAMMAGMRPPNPGVLMFRGWGLERRVGADVQIRLNALQEDLKELRKKLEPAVPFVHGVQDLEKPSNLKVSIRGNPMNLGAEVPRHFLSVLSPGDPKPFERGSGRLELAEAILKEPLAMRVMANRVWKGLFGTGIVDTPSNFGITGERPTNPELLEYLASEFSRNGMSVKKLLREMLLSSVYQLSTENDEASFAKDAGNRLYWRANRKRMDAEQIRDSILSVAGNLDESLGGPSAELSPANTRRTVYGKVSRYKLDQFLQLFDFPSPNLSAEKRFITTVPSQRLFLMNSDFMQLEGEDLAKRVAGEPNNRARIRKAYLLVYGRVPTEEETQLGLDYLRTEPLRVYEEVKNKAKEDAAKPATPSAATVDSKTEAVKPADGKTEAAKPATPAPATPAPATAEAAGQTPPGENAAPAAEVPMGMGMMEGMFPFPGGPGARQGTGGPAAVKYEATAWGRYAKILFSASEFLFIN